MIRDHVSIAEITRKVVKIQNLQIKVIKKLVIEIYKNGGKNAEPAKINLEMFICRRHPRKIKLSTGLVAPDRLR